MAEHGGHDALPTVESLLPLARVLVRRYASQQAYEQALSREESENATNSMKVPIGTPWTAPTQDPPLTSEATTEDLEGDSSDSSEDVEPTEDQDNTPAKDNDDDEDSEPPPKEPGIAKEKVYVEAKGFTGDRVFANEVLFLEDAGWWIEVAYAVPDGDIGRVYEILKVSMKYTMTIDTNSLLDLDIYL